jgi:DNA replication and repair protein RecF
MPLSELMVDDLRCIEHAELSLHPGHSLIWGSNGSGKSSLLEGIFLLGRGRSFRTRTSQRLIRHGRDALVVFGRMDDPLATTLGIQIHQNEGTHARIAGGSVRSLAELSQRLAVQVIEPGVHQLVEEGGATRRRWLDWGVFQLQPQFVDVWTRYTRALNQRNAALKSQVSQAPVWEPEISKLGEQIAAWRGEFLEKLQPHWHAAIAQLAELEVDLHYQRGWNQEVPLAESLLAGRARDEARGVTHSGPHRADVAIRMKGRLAREVLSRGQQKLVAVAMTLAQLSLMQDSTSVTPTLLLDDPAAELDRDHLERFIGLVKRLRCQLVVTALSTGSQPFGAPERLFHVERGKVRPV